MDGIFRRRNLPHWDVPGHPVFITGCLQGSISQVGLGKIRRLRQELARKIRPAGVSIRDWKHSQSKMLFEFVDELLDFHSPVQHLQDDRLANIVVNAFLEFDRIRYSLLSFVVMPSHHHWLFNINEQWAEANERMQFQLNKKWRSPREIISQSVQSFTGHECNKLLTTTGRFWQQETYDHWARDDEEMHSIAEYIENNPVRAGLVSTPSQYRWSSAYYRANGLWSVS